MAARAWAIPTRGSPVDAVTHVLRCFKDDDVTHVDGRVDPVADVEIIETELMLADIDSIEKRRAGLVRKLRAAGVIHGGFEKGFIRAETITYDDLIGCGCEAAAKDAGRMRVEGKCYTVRDGDVLPFLFNT